MSDLFIGLMSGTSMDAVDAVLAQIGGGTPKLRDAISHPLPEALRARLLALSSARDDTVDLLGRTDLELAHVFADAVQALLRHAGIEPQQVRAIGSHGQTVRHHPAGPWPYTVQIGDPNCIAERTGITTVADFRRRDMAAGGQGAPLVPAFHAAVLRTSAEDRCVLNIGGIANLTVLPADSAAPVTGFDTGPGNVLLDYWAQRHLGAPRDDAGGWARGGTPDTALLQQLLSDAYFRQPPPKSTGREHFNGPWLELALQELPAAPRDVQTTITELTARTAADAVRTHAVSTRRLLVCGGGSHNAFLMERLAEHLPDVEVQSTDTQGMNPDWVEGLAFAWLAHQTLQGRPGNVPTVTGAHHGVVLGGIYPGAGMR
ncbi:MAG: anhydro-N-acetylmuramic acid kinase [Gammaproteobacteria bacterium]